MAGAIDWKEVKRNWAAPPELAGSGPREVRMSAAGKALSVFMALLLVGAAVAVVYLSRAARTDAAKRAELDASSVDVQGVVTRRWRTGGKSDTPKVSYQFQYDGRTYIGTSSAPRRAWDDLSIGSPIAIRVVPGRPELNHPRDWEYEAIPAWMPWLPGSMLALTAILIVFMIRRQIALLRDGRAAPALVTGHRRIKGGQMLVYEFQLPDGAVRKGRGGKTRTPPEVGTTITVVYDPENPKRNAPYPMDLARLDR